MSNIIIGGGGFIGRHIATELIRRGDEVIVYDISDGFTPERNARISFIRSDILDKAQLKKILKDVNNIYHLAGLLGTAELFGNPQNAIEVNMIGLINVLEIIAKQQNAKLFYPSSPYIWRNIYSLTKHAGEELCLAYNRAYGVDTRILRLWNIYGPYQQMYPIRKVVPVFILQALAGLPLEIYGNGNQVVQLTYVEDAARIIVDFMKLSGHFSNPFDLGSAVSTVTTVKALARTIISCCNSKSQLVFLQKRFGEFDEMEPYPLQNILELLPRYTFTALNDGLSRTIDFYKGISKKERSRVIGGLKDVKHDSKSSNEIMW
jgi:nucleoside-diphosphate-sugar epimerase